MSSVGIGVALSMIAGLMSGNCMLPVKFAKRWKWENVWLLFSLVSLFVLPWVLAFTLVGSLLDVYRSVPLAMFATPLLFGTGWGVAQILFGISVRRLGLGLGYAIIVGLGAILGTLVPLLLGQRKFVSHGSLLLVFSGVTVMALAIAVAAWGGQLRDAASRAGAPQSAKGERYLAALLLALLCGLMAPMLNFAFTFGHGLALAAIQFGNSPVAAAYAVWPIALLGGLIPNLGYSVYLLQRNRSWKVFHFRDPDALWACTMAVLWMGAFALYGMSSIYLGTLGTSVGWGLFQIFMIATATLSGMFTAEWAHAPRRSVVFLGIGMAGLVIATFLLAFAGS